MINKFIPALALATLTLFGTSCGNSGEATSDQEQIQAEQESQSNNPLLSGMSRMDFGERGLPLSLVLPDTMNNPFQMNITDWGETEIKCGKYFQIGIAEGGDIALRKSDLEEDLLYKFEMIEETENVLVYKQFVEGDESVSPFYHFYMIANYGGIQYEIQDLKTGETMPEKAVLKMYEAAKHFKPTEIINP